MHKVIDGIATLNTAYDILLIGHTGIGKSSLVYKFLGEDPLYHHSQTEELHYTQVSSNCACSDSSFSTNKAKYTEITILDSTSASETYSSRKAQQIRNARSVLFLYSVIDRKSFEALEYNIEAVKMMRDNELPPFVVAGLKLDMYDAYQVLYQEGEELASKYGAIAFAEVSSQQDHNVEKIFTPLVDTVLRARHEKHTERRGLELLSVMDILSENEHFPALLVDAQATKPGLQKYESTEEVVLCTSSVNSLQPDERQVLKEDRIPKREKTGCCIIM